MQSANNCVRETAAGSNVDVLSVLAAGFAFLMFILSIVMWPVYIAGIQILTAEIARKPIQFGRVAQ
jgi:hypothetical protein